MKKSQDYCFPAYDRRANRWESIAFAWLGGAACVVILMGMTQVSRFASNREVVIQAWSGGQASPTEVAGHDVEKARTNAAVFELAGAWKKGNRSRTDLDLRRQGGGN